MHNSGKTLEQLMAELPAPGTPHECRATQYADRPALQNYTCYIGQWTVHGPHDETLSGGRVVHCAGKTKNTVLRSQRPV